MFNSVVVRKTREHWYLAVDALYENKVASIDWNSFLPATGGTKHQREYLLRSIKGLLTGMIEAPRQTRGDKLAHSTVLNWTFEVRRLVNWMTSREIWRFSALTGEDVATYIERCGVKDDGSGNVAQFTFFIRVRFLQDMWELRRHYVGPLRVNPAFLDGELRQPLRSRSSWKALDESVALPLIGDAIRWIETHGEYLLSVRQRRWDLTRRWVGVTKGARQRKILEFYEDIEQEPGLQLLRQKLKMGACKTFGVLREALGLTDGACFILFLFLEGMRVSELVRLDSGCLRTERSPDGREHKRLHGIAAKQGGKHRTWITCDPVAEAVNYCERASSGARKALGIKALFINHRHGIAALGKAAVRIPRGVVATRMRRFANSPHRSSPHLSRLHPHVARKTFARFVVSRDKHALESLAYHFGHVHRAITDSYYVGSDIELHKLLAEEARSDLVRGLTDLLDSRYLGGKAGASMEIVKRSLRTTFRGKKGLKKIVEKLIEDGVQLAPCDWGYCVYSQALSACRGDERGPNEARRSPDICSGCANFAVTERHRAWWEVRMDRDDEFLTQEGLPEQTVLWVQQRRANTARLLSGLNEGLKLGRPSRLRESHES
ncbi:integrase [Paraburkholderia terricola]|uniref:tyrosine-type recombinase/integrase n=1 Tax=Paraburkholderia terricola TaxID=169427 RepID=UPI00286448A2|nr:tyrosine-type recombinase/integrase [Paraburkholderia terricola]MDR6493182.1 integrase [Paraburkholderia terricola]